MTKNTKFSMICISDVKGPQESRLEDETDSPKRSYTQDNQIISKLFLSLIWDYDDSVLSEIPSAWSS